MNLEGDSKGSHVLAQTWVYAHNCIYYIKIGIGLRLPFLSSISAQWETELSREVELTFLLIVIRCLCQTIG